MRSLRTRARRREAMLIVLLDSRTHEHQVARAQVYPELNSISQKAITRSRRACIESNSGTS